MAYSTLAWLIPVVIIVVVLGIAALVCFVLIVRFSRKPQMTSEVQRTGADASSGGMGSVSMGAPAARSALDPSQTEQMMFEMRAANEELSRTGQQATARVLQFMPLGIPVNGNNSVVNLMLEVRPQTGPSFTSQVFDVVIAMASFPKFQPGQIINVRYNPHDLTRVAIEPSEL